MQALKFTGFDDAILGIADVWDTSGMREERYIYSGEKIVSLLMGESDMDYEEALEYISFNVEGAYVGPTTPIVVWETHGEEE